MGSRHHLKRVSLESVATCQGPLCLGCFSGGGWVRTCSSQFTFLQGCVVLQVTAFKKIFWPPRDTEFCEKQMEKYTFFFLLMSSFTAVEHFQNLGQSPCRCPDSAPVGTVSVAFCSAEMHALLCNQKQPAVLVKLISFILHSWSDSELCLEICPLWLDSLFCSRGNSSVPSRWRKAAIKALSPCFLPSVQICSAMADGHQFLPPLRTDTEVLLCMKPPGQWKCLNIQATYKKGSASVSCDGPQTLLANIRTKEETNKRTKPNKPTPQHLPNIFAD